jgi:uncharacterized protein YcfJ
MDGLTVGIWQIADQSLQWIGRSAAWVLLRRHPTRDESTLCAATGGALVCMVLGGVVGFALSDPSQNIDAMGGTTLGCLLGVCMGFVFGVCVETISSMLKDLLSTLSPK